MRPDEKVAVVTVVNSVESMRALLCETDLVVFVTAGMLGEADRVKEQHPRIKVVVMTGLIPRDRVIILDSGWATKELVKTLLTSI